MSGGGFNNNDNNNNNNNNKKKKKKKKKNIFTYIAPVTLKFPQKRITRAIKNVKKLRKIKMFKNL